MKVLPVTGRDGALVAADLLAAAETVHRQLRPHLPADYAGRMKEVFASGAEMAVAVEDGKVAGLTVFRVIEKTFSYGERAATVAGLIVRQRAVRATQA